MLIHRIAAQLYTAEALQDIDAALMAGEDATLAISQSGRTLAVAAQFARRPRPTVYIVSGEDAADRAARSIAAYVGADRVVRFPERKDYPWKNAEPDDAVVAARCAALARIARGDACIMVASARSLLRCVPPLESRYWASRTYSVGEEVAFEEVPGQLVSMGYTRADAADAPGLFRVLGDTVDIWAAQATAPVRIEFFGDEIDRIRLMVASTGQTIGDEDSVEISPVRELALTDEAVRRISAALYLPAQDDTELAALLELVEARVVTPELERFLPLLYGETVSPLAHVHPNALVILSEPRSLFDDCSRAYEDLERRASDAKIARLDGLYVRPQELDFGRQQRLNYVSLIRAGGSVTAELKIEQPALAGSDNRFMSRIQEVVNNRFACVFAIPDRGARESMELSFTDENIPFEESLQAAPENAGAVGGARVRVELLKRDVDALNARGIDEGGERVVPTLTRGRMTFVDAPIPSGVVVPAAHLAVFSLADLNARMDGKRGRAHRRVDITEVTFPFKPGDYVVHSTHGVALFSEIVRQEVAGKERDYFLLEYAGGDKLYVPLEQVDRITRYVRPRRRQSPSHASEHGGLEPGDHQGAQERQEARLRPRRPVHAPQLDHGLRLRARQRDPGRDGGELPLRRDARPARRYRRYQGRHGVDQAHGPPALWRRGLRQDRGCPARGVQVRGRRPPGHGAVPHDHLGAAALRDVLRALRAVRRGGRGPIALPYPRAAAPRARGLCRGARRRAHRHPPPALRRRQPA